jgi:hypothetical protein
VNETETTRERKRAARLAAAVRLVRPQKGYGCAVELKLARFSPSPDFLALYRAATVLRHSTAVRLNPTVLDKAEEAPAGRVGRIRSPGPGYGLARGACMAGSAMGQAVKGPSTNTLSLC